MSENVVVKIRYCGGCNPEIDRVAAVKQLTELLGHKANWTYDTQMQTDFVLHVNGCAHACIDEESARAGIKPCISIQGLRVDREETPEKNIAETAAAKLAVAIEEKDETGNLR